MSLDPYAQAVLADGAVAYWRLDETSGTTAHDLVGGAHGTISGGVTLNQAGALAAGNPAMAFDGTTGKIVTASAITLGAPFTVESWIQTPFTSGQSPFLSIRPPVHGYFGIQGSKLFSYYGGALVGNGIVADGVWHHVVFTSDGATMRCYRDGIFDGSVNLSPVAPITNLVALGWDQPNAVEYWLGAIDDVAIYPTALTPTQITAHYLASYKPAIPPPMPTDAYGQAVIRDGALAYWRLDETYGRTARDLINGHDGALSGGVTINQPGAVPGNPAMAFDGVTGKITPTATMPVLSSVEVWIKCSVSARQSPCVSNYGSGGVYLGMAGNTRAVCYGVTTTYGGPPLNDGIWHHVVWVFTNPGCNLYVDGQLEAANALETGGATGRHEPTLAYDAFNNEYWPGLLDDVAIYPTALTPTQIAAHYAAAFPPPPPKVLDSSAIVNALIAKLGADSTLLGLVPNGIYEDLAPPDSTRFVIVSQILATDALTFVAGRTIEDVYCLVEARILSSTRGDVRAAAYRIDELLENGTLDIPDYALMEITRQEFVRGTEVDEVDPTIVWKRRGGRYRIRVSHDPG